MTVHRLFHLVLGLVLVGAPAATTIAGESAHGIVPPPHAPPGFQVRVWGTPAAQRWLDAQSTAYREGDVPISVHANLTGSDVGMAGLYTGQADVVLMGREATESEIKAFEWIYRYRPVGVEIMAGSLDKPGRAPAVVVLVHRDNPINALSMAQLDGMIGNARLNGWRDNQPVVESARTADANIRFWGEVGLGGKRATQPIRLHMPEAESGTGKFLRMRLVADSNRLHWDAITEYADPVQGEENAGRRIAEAVGKDVAAIGFSSLTYHDPRYTRIVAIRPGAHQNGVVPTAGSITSKLYPLARTLYAYINKHPVNGVNADVHAWLTQVLTGDEDGRGSGGYLPLSISDKRLSLTLIGSSKPVAKPAH